MLSPQQKHSIEEALVSTYWEFIYTDDTPPPTTLLATLEERLPHIPRESWGKRLQWGGVFVNGEPAREDFALPFPCRIEYYEPRFNFEDPYSYFPRFDPRSIIYEDEDLLCMAKPAGLPAIPAREQEHISAKRYIEEYLAAQQPGKPVTIHLPSRLDMSTTGLMVVSKNPALHNVLQQFFERRTVQKFYLLSTQSEIRHNGEFHVELPIGRDPDHPILRRPRQPLEGGKIASTTFTVLDTTPQGTSILCAKPHTGRTHQIRVHAAFSGFPITGDKFYLGAPAETLHLLSARIKLPHPRTRAPLDITIPETMLPSWVSAQAFEALKLL